MHQSVRKACGSKHNRTASMPTRVTDPTAAEPLQHSAPQHSLLRWGQHLSMRWAKELHLTSTSSGLT
eukprot:9039926-Alexandrium_andersonii.AAC.1